MIRADDVSYDYEALRALHSVSVEIAERSITALVGANGAGKTTLMRCLAGLLRPISGRLCIAGIDVLAAPRAAHRQLGYLSDLFGLYDDLTVLESLRHTAAMRGVAASVVEQAVQRAIERTGLGKCVNARAGTLSRGLRQRLGIAQAIVHEPKVLLLDEPASGLDPEARLALSGLLRGLRDAGMTLLVSSHILAELEDYSTHMIVMRAGRILDNVKLGSEGATQGQELELELAEPCAEALAVARGSELVLEVAAHDHGLRIRLKGGSNERAELLKVLVNAGVPVSGLREHKRLLQDQYFDTVRGGGG